jgi:hypothetical protein
VLGQLLLEVFSLMMSPKPKIFLTANFPTALTIHVHGMIDRDEVVESVDRILDVMPDKHRRTTQKVPAKFRSQSHRVTSSCSGLVEAIFLTPLAFYHPHSTCMRQTH